MIFFPFFPKLTKCEVKNEVTFQKPTLRQNIFIRVSSCLTNKAMALGGEYALC